MHSETSVLRRFCHCCTILENQSITEVAPWYKQETL
jgi:hypothetical protein